MGLHKLTAGDGYTYLTRQVAVHDATDRGHTGLGDYYSEKGEAPGRWWGSGLAALDLPAGSLVSEQQMRNLFGEGRHPDAERLEDAALDAGAGLAEAKRASQLGRLFAVYRGNAPELVQETARRFSDYNLRHGLHWKTPVPLEERARIRTQVGDELFTREHHRAPLNDRERSGFLAQASRQQTTAVAGYDLTFTPVKSVSALWALANPAIADQVEAAHEAAVEDALAWLEQHVLFTRRGQGGVQQVNTRGMVAARFTHRDARSGDPNLHTHLALSNKVQDLTGRWLAVDGRPLFKANVTLSEMYNTRLEAELTARIGVRFTPRAGQQDTWGAEAKRAVREVVGVDARLTDAWSRRSRAIEARRRDLAVAFQVAHGRPPTAVESIQLAQRANLETRQAKHEPRAEADQRAGWRREAIGVLGSAAAVDEMLGAVLGQPVQQTGVVSDWVAVAAEQAIRAVESYRATWQIWHVRAEAHRLAREVGIPLDALDEAVERAVTVALDTHCVAFTNPDALTADPVHTSAGAVDGPETLVDPPVLRRTDGSSVYVQAGSQRYTSALILEAEERILAAAARSGGRAISAVRVGVALAEGAANGTVLNASQQALVREMATSGRRVQLALAPAGTGKTTAMAVLTRAWLDSGGTVVGLAPSAVAAQQLRESIAPTQGGHSRHSLAGTVVCETLSKLTWSLRPDQDTPAWVRDIGPRTLVLVDEAGMAATTDLARMIDYVTARGASVRLIGDDRQLAAIAAGGVMRDIAHQCGAISLTEVRRFDDPAEAAATLALRDGDPAALGYYTDHGRVHVGDLAACADQAFTAWAADTASGKNSILLAPTRDLVADLNTRARQDRLQRAGTHDQDSHSRVVTLGDGTHASAGDVIVTRHNNRRLAITGTDWVKNGDRWTITQVRPDGSVTARHRRLHASVLLPGEYVNKHVQLGYATTIHGAQGVTVDTSHTVLTGEEDRTLLYVAASRGRSGNQLYVATGHDGDRHTVIRPEAIRPPTALDQLSGILARDNSPTSATTALHEQADPAVLLRGAAARYHDALATAAQHVLGPAALDRIDDHANHLHRGLTDAPAWPTLRAHLAIRALTNTSPGLERDPSEVLQELQAAIRIGSLDDALDPAAVVHQRLEQSDHDGPADGPQQPAPTPELMPETAFGAGLDAGAAYRLIRNPPRPGPLPWLPGIPALLAADRDWGPYLNARHQQVRGHVASVRATANAWTPVTAPPWAVAYLGTEPQVDDQLERLRADLAVWRAVHDVPVNDHRPTGDRLIGAPGDHQSQLTRRARQHHTTYPYAQRTWFHQLPQHVRDDPWIGVLGRHLARLERAGAPVSTYLSQALSQPRPLPDQLAAAALWWRLVPRLGPAAIAGDTHTGALLQPDWKPVLESLVGAARADFLTHTPAWPALVAAVDDACQYHGWNPQDILTSGLGDLPTRPIRAAEVADTLVLRIAMLTDPPPDSALETTAVEPDDSPPHDLDQIYRDSTPTWFQSLPTTDLPDIHGGDGALQEPHPATRTLSIDPDPYGYWTTTPREEPVTAEDAFPQPGMVSMDRILELNREALAFYSRCYPQSWAPTYLRERLGTDLAEPILDTSGLRAIMSVGPLVGYAPPGPRSLLRHLTSSGASIVELDQAGLIRPRQDRDGTRGFIDAFRDRLVFPIRHHHTDSADVVGFVGRRNPTKTSRDYAGPKYLNTKTTTAYTKHRTLFGYAEGAGLIAQGALPVLVEGPLDAYAVTLATAGTAVGLAPLGTALTRDQTELLLPHMSSRRHHIAVATDSDSAGWAAARAAYWYLTAADLDPTYIQLPANTDPAALLREEPALLQEAINRRVPLGPALTDNLIATAHDITTPTERDRLVDQASRIIAARTPETWTDHISGLNDRLRLATGYLQYRVLTASIQRDQSLREFTQTGLTEARLDHRHPRPQPSRQPALIQPAGPRQPSTPITTPLEERPRVEGTSR